jgi:hypothetical protein
LTMVHGDEFTETVDRVFGGLVIGCQQFPDKLII